MFKDNEKRMRKREETNIGAERQCKMEKEKRKSKKKTKSPLIYSRDLTPPDAPPSQLLAKQLEEEEELNLAEGRQQGRAQSS